MRVSVAGVGGVGASVGGAEVGGVLDFSKAKVVRGHWKWSGVSISGRAEGEFEGLHILF